LAEVHVSRRDVLAVWSPGVDADFAMVIDGAARTQEDVLGCAVLALEHMGVDRPRIGTVQRAAGVM
jgi:hypothetical protein